MTRLLAVLVVIVTPHAPAVRAQATPASIRWEPYSIKADGGAIAGQLGRLVVPERRAEPNSRPITIAFARIPSTSSAPGAPILYLDGGPGGSGVGAAGVPALASLFRALRATSDVILLSQRGTGLSDRIGCRGGASLPEETLTSLDRMNAEIAARQGACAESLRAQGVDLAGYTTDESADDIEAIRAALGAPRVSIVGFSYGTHLALATLRRHGDRIERAVLLGVEGPDDTWKLPSTFDAQVSAIDTLVKADAHARRVMPDFAGTLRALVARTATAPISITLTGAATPRTMQVGAAGILYLLRRDIGDTNDVPWIPAFVYETHAGHYRRLEQLLARRLPSLETGVQMMATAMDCSSAASALKLAEIRRQEPTSIFGGLTNFPFPEVCASARIPPLPDSFRVQVQSAVPTLFVSGTLDSNTPPHQAAAVMEGFANSAHLIVDGAGHESTLTEAVRARIATFLTGRDVKSERLRADTLRFQLPSRRGAGF